MVEGNGRRAEVPVSWPDGIRERHILLLQAILDYEDRKSVCKNLELSERSVSNLMININEEFGGDASEINGVALAIVFGIQHSFLNTENIPDIGEIKLKGREAEILSLMVQGLRVSSIANRLSLSSFTVKNRQNHIYKKFGVRGKYWAIAAGLKVLKKANLI